MKENEIISKKISWDEGRNFRFKSFFEEKEINQENFSLKTGLPQSNLSAILNNKRALGEKTIDKYITPFFPDLNKLWLLTGEGSMLNSNNKVSNTNGNVVIGNNNRAINGKEIENKEEVSSKVKIPYYDVDFAGGWSSEELFSNVMPLYHISAPEFERAEFACNLRGNSISKRIKSGSIVGLKEIKDWETYFPTNELYGVITKNDLRTIKIVKRSKEEGFLDLIPDALPEYNDPPYEAERVPINFIQKMFQVVAWGFYERLIM